MPKSTSPKDNVKTLKALKSVPSGDRKVTRLLRVYDSDQGVNKEYKEAEKDNDLERYKDGRYKEFEVQPFVSEYATLPSINSPRQSSGSCQLLPTPFLPKVSSCPLLNLIDLLKTETFVPFSSLSSPNEEHSNLRSQSLDFIVIGDDIDREMGQFTRTLSSFSTDSQSDYDFPRSYPQSRMNSLSIQEDKEESGGGLIPSILISTIPIISSAPISPKKTFNLRDRLLCEKQSIPTGTFTRPIPSRVVTSQGLSDNLDRHIMSSQSNKEVRHIRRYLCKEMNRETGEMGRDMGRDTSPVMFLSSSRKSSNNNSVNGYSLSPSPASSSLHNSVSPTRCGTPDIPNVFSLSSGHTSGNTSGHTTRRSSISSVHPSVSAQQSVHPPVLLPGITPSVLILAPVLTLAHPVHTSVPALVHSSASHSLSATSHPSHPLHTSHSFIRDTERLGCLLDAETIAAKAADRALKRIHVTLAKESSMSSQVQVRNQSILDKSQRSERKLLLKGLEMKRQFWMKILIMSHFHHNSVTQFPELLSQENMRKNKKYAAQKMLKLLIRNRDMCVLEKEKNEIKFLKLVNKLEVVCKHFLIKMKTNRAASTLIGFLRSSAKCTTYGLSYMKVTFFLKCVKMIQRNIRHFLACREARVTALGILWNAAEREFIQTMVRPKNGIAPSKKKPTRSDLVSLVPLVNNRSERTAIKRNDIYDKKWSATECKFQDLLQKSVSKKSQAQIASQIASELVSERKTSDSYLLPKNISDEWLLKKVRELRKTRVYENSIRLQGVSRETLGQINFSGFNIEDAAALMSAGSTHTVLALSQETMSDSDNRPRKMFTPSSVIRFQIYRDFDYGNICKYIKHMHERQGTFHGTR